MTAGDTQEPHVALLTAGLLLVALGVLIATLPAGMGLGIGLAVAGVILFIATAIVASREWRNRQVSTQLPEPDPDRFWNAEKRLKSLMGASGGVGIAALAIPLVYPGTERWATVWISGAVLVTATVAWAVVLWRRRRREANPKPRPPRFQRG